MGAFLGLIGMVASGYLLLRAVRNFQREWREAEITRAAALPQQTIHIPAAGDLRLFLEGPRFRAWGKRLSYAMSEAETGRPVVITPTFTGSGVRSRTRSRVERGRFVLPAPGPYLLQVGGLDPSDHLEYAVVLMRPCTAKLLAFILSCVFLGMILIGSLVGAILALAL